MFFSVILLDKTKLCIPAGWLQHIDIVRCFNNVHKRHEKRVIFFSSDELRTPDFLLPISNAFNEDSDACYHAHVLKAFHSKEECLNDLKKRRALAPPAYFPTRNSCASNVNADIDREMALDQKITIKKEVESLRKALLNNNRTSQSIDLTESDTEDFQNGLDEPITIEDELNVLNEVGSAVNGSFDILSGNIPFQQDDTVSNSNSPFIPFQNIQCIHLPMGYLHYFQSGDRMYPSHNLTLRQIAISVLTMYNQRALYKEEIYDSKFVYFLVLEVLGKERLLLGNVNQNRFEFAKQLFEIRLKGQPNASERMEKYNTLLVNRINSITIRSDQMEKQNADLAQIQTTK